ncbi:MAG: hypothetical protein WC009_07810 [Methylotenera sp.]
MMSVSETLKNIFRQILSVVAAFYLLFGIKMDFSWERAKKNFDERKKLFKDTALQVSVVIFFLLILFFHFCVPGISFLSVISVSFLFSALAFIFAMVPVWIVEKILKTRFSPQPSSDPYFMGDTTFKPVFIPVPTSPPRFNLAA